MSGHKLTETKMEVITKGSFDHEDAFSRPSTSSHSVASVSQLSLECLPPDAPYFTMVDVQGDSNVSTCTDVSRHTSMEEVEEEEEERGVASHLAPLFKEGGGVTEMDTGVNELYHRIVELSGKIQHKLEKSGLSQETTAQLGVVGGASTPGDGDVLSDIARGNVDGRGESTNMDSSTQGSFENVSDVPSMNSEATSHTGPSHLSACHTSTSTVHSTSCSSPCSSEKSVTHFDDPKLQKAYERMLKLDERLSNVSKREREVKRQRRLLEEEMERVGAGQPSSDLVVFDNGDGSIPVFSTQPDELAAVLQSGVLAASETSLEEEEEEEEEEEDSAERRKKRSEKEDSKFETNFIKRNIELVADAAALVMMTKAEKHRLQELMEENTEAVEDVEESMALCPHISTSSAFSLEEKDLQRLRELDSQLESFPAVKSRDTILSKSWEAILSSANDSSISSPRLPAVCHAPTNACLSHTHLSTTTVETEPPGSPIPNRCGERRLETESWQEQSMVLQQPEMGVAGDEVGVAFSEQLKEEDIISTASQLTLLRHLQIPHGDMQRLQAIDQQLHLIHQENQTGFQGVVLEQGLLDQLVHQCRIEQGQDGLPLPEPAGSPRQ